MGLEDLVFKEYMRRKHDGNKSGTQSGTSQTGPHDSTQQDREEDEAEQRRKESRQRDEEERQRNEREEKMRQEREEKQRKEREEKIRQEREAKERETREYNTRQRAKKAAQEREQLAREWTDAWSRYNTAWEAIETSKKPAIPDNIPWPVKSGRFIQVNESNVRQFYQKAVPTHLAQDPAEEMFRVISNENKRWHTDKLTSRFGSDIVKGEYRDALNMITKLMINLRTEAKIGRKQ
jgi:hypothetical protein